MKINMMTKLNWLVAVMAMVLAPALANAAGWGTIKGKFVVDGDPPEAKPVDASKDAFCANHDPKVIDHTVASQRRQAGECGCVFAGRSRRQDRGPS